MKPTYLLNILLAVALVIVSVKLVSKKSATPSESAAPATSAAASPAGTAQLDTKTSATQVAGHDEFKEWDVTEDMGDNPFQLFRQPGGLVLCAGDREKSNAMAIGWGTLGTLWGQPVTTVYVAEGRYTFQFMEKASYYTIMTFDDAKVLDYMGHKSGRDGDKAAACGLHTLYTENGTPYYAEATSVIECKIMYSAPFDPARFKDEVPTNLYSNFPAGIHTQYVGKVVMAMKK